jgi:arabinose-5-phosphate isomerase
MRGFEAEDFARNHPGGSLGFRLSRVEDHMRPPAECRIARQDETVREVLSRLSRPGRRTGAIMLVDDAGRLSGLFTDSDLARLFERGREAALDGPICDVMTPNPKCVVAGTRMTEAVELLARYKISELLVVDVDRRPIGLVDITDVVAHLPTAAAAPNPATRAA